MRNYILLKDQTITFPLRIQQGNDLSFHYALANCVTPWGFIVPLHQCSWTILDYLEDGTWPEINDCEGLVCALITHDGRYYEYYAAEKAFFRRRIPTGPGTWHVRSMRFPIEELVHASVKMGGTITDIIQRVEGSSIVIPGSMVTLSLDTVMGMLKERYPEPLALPRDRHLSPERELKALPVLG